MENDHKFTKSKSRYRQWYQSFSTARNTLNGIETMRMIQKGQIRNIGKDVVKQNQFVRSLFGIAACSMIRFLRNFLLKKIFFQRCHMEWQKRRDYGKRK
jgi:transposase-like protein